ncbi:hypothetical protein BJ742DRAFT_663294, partial [Cladochytrium replicatum]
AGGYLSDQAIQQQIAVVNNDYKDTGFSLALSKIKRTQNADWFRGVSPSTFPDDMKKTKGGPNTLNIYSVSFRNAPTNYQTLLGYATFPSWYSGKPWDDGVVLLYDSLPGGKNTRFNLGKTLTHEAGHWFGLLHTFQDQNNSGNGCIGPGDNVADTPAEKIPFTGCPLPGQSIRDSCPNDPGPDPVTNYMDYADDRCMLEFTRGQLELMRAQWALYR